MGRCHVVTGGCRGVGRALAERLLDDGGTVAAVELDPAAAVAHLLSDAASFVNGATVPVDGGRSVLGPDPRRATRAVGVPRRQRKLVDIPVGRMVAVRADAAQEQEWLRQLSLIYGGLTGIGVLMVQPFLTASSLDLPAKVCVVAFSVAIPLLASLVVLNRQEAFRRRATRSVVAELTRVVAQTCAFVGVVAGFWHILWIAGVGVLASGLAAVAVHSASYWRLERDQAPTPQEGEEPGDAEP